MRKTALIEILLSYLITLVSVIITGLFDMPSVFVIISFLVFLFILSYNGFFFVKDILKQKNITIVVKKKEQG